VISEAQLVLILFGLVAAGYPLLWGLYFVARRGLSRRLGYMLLGEAISMGFAVYFAMNSYFHLYNRMDPWLVAGIRMAIFSTALFSTIHLVLYFRRRLAKLS